LVVIQIYTAEFGGGREGVAKIPDTWSGIDEAKYAFLLSTYCRYAHRDLPTMPGLAMMMVMLVRVQVIHIGPYCMWDGWMCQEESELDNKLLPGRTKKFSHFPSGSFVTPKILPDYKRNSLIRVSYIPYQNEICLLYNRLTKIR
jgi:hypothetical protein